ncbi:MAG: Gfo/Idh/MocA family protein [Phycisphaerales bacterium]
MSTHDHPAPGPFSESRRRFLATTAGAAAVSAFAASVGSAAPARGGIAPKPVDPAPKAKSRPPLKEGQAIRVGVIGIGGPGGCAMGLGHAQALVSLAKKNRDNVEVVALCDLNDLFLENGRSQVEKAQPGVKVDTYRRSADLLAREDIHGVVIATPEHWHSLNGVEAILAGKDVYLEKPMCLNLPDSIMLERVASANPDTIVQIGTQMTQLPKYHEARKMVQSGLIGVPTFSQTSYCRNSRTGEWHYTINPAWKPGENLDWETWCAPLGQTLPWDPKLYYQWRRYRRTSTGIIGDLLVHVLTPMILAIDQGWPVRVLATGAHHADKAMENHDNVHIAVQFETGHQMLVAGSTCNEAGLEVMIRGHKGNIYLGGRHCEMRPERTYSEELDSKKVECPDIGNDQDVHRLAWLKSIRTREKPFSSVDLHMKVMVIVDLATRSMWEGAAFRFDPSTMTASKV